MDFFSENNLLETISTYDLKDYQKILLNLCKNITGSKGNLNMYNHWVKELIPKRIESLSFINEDDEEVNFKFYSYTLPLLYPNDCRIEKKAYKCQITITINNVQVTLGSIPIMLGSSICLLTENNSPGKIIYLDDLKNQSEKLISNNELIKKQECIGDPYGYYIVSSERSLVTQEKERTDLPLVIYDSKTKKIMLRYTYNFKNKREIFEIKLGELNSITINLVNTKIEFINIFIVFYIFLSDTYKWNEMEQIILNMILKHSNSAQYSKLRIFLNLTMYVFKKDYIIDIYDDKIKERILENFDTDLSFKQLQQLYETDFLKNIPNKNQKIEQLSFFVYKYLLVLTKQLSLDSRDDWGNKIYDCGAKEIEIIFDLMLSDILNNNYRSTDKIIQTMLKQQRNYVYNDIYIEQFGRTTRDYGMLEQKFRSSFNGRWGLNKKRDEISENSKRDTPMALWSQSVKSSAPVNVNSKIMEAREIHSSQRCRHCVSETPEGGKIGLIKNLCITSCYSLERDENEIMSILLQNNVITTIKDDGKEYSVDKSAEENTLEQQINEMFKSNEEYVESSDEESEDNDDLISKRANMNIYILVMNGKVQNVKNKTAYINISKFDMLFVRKQIKKLHYDIEIYSESVTRTLYIYSNSSRLVVPYFIITNKDNLTDKDSKISLDKMPVEDILKLNLKQLVENEIIEFLSPKEETSETITICNSVDKFRNLDFNTTTYFTHCNVDPIQMFSLSTSVAPMANHQPGPRTSYQAGMIKQALGEYHTNYHIKMDRGFKRLLRATRSFTETTTYPLPRLDIMPSGQTVNVAFYPEPDNQEDAIVLSRDCIKSGMFNYYKYVTVTFDNTNKMDELCSPDEGMQQVRDKYKHIVSYGPMTGLPKINSYISVGDCIICKRNINDKRQNSVMSGIGEEGYVDRIVVKNNLIRVKLRKKREYTEGDKTAIRYSQKGTVGRVEDKLVRIISGKDKGIKPDVYFNPHGFPSRLTMGLLIEGLLTKLALYNGQRYNTSSFQKHDLENIKYELMELGVNIEEETINSDNVILENKIYVVPLYEQVLKHHVLDKIQMRNNKGIKDMYTHQPRGGRLLGGGQRVGEMEKDAFVAHGVPEVIRDRMLYNSDVFKLIVCRECGYMLKDSGSKQGCYDNYSFEPEDIQPKIQCNICGSDNLGYVKIPYSFKQLLHFLIYLGMTVLIKTKEINN